MSILTGVSDFFGLDIGSTAIRVAQLKGNTRVKNLVKYGFVSADEKLLMSSSANDVQKVAKIIAELLAKTGISTKNVAVGLPTSRVFTTVVDFDKLSPSEMASAISYQADSLIPTPIGSSKIDWAVIGASPADPNKVEVLLSSASNDFIETRLDMLESIGLNVVSFEPDTMALARSVIPADATTPHMVLDMGNIGTDLTIVMGGAPRLTRSIGTGTDAIVRAAAQNLNVDMKQADQFVFKFGLSKNKLDDQVYNAIVGTVDQLVNEIEKSIKFFQDRYTNVKIDRVVVTGGASALPEFPLYLANKFGLNVEIGNAWRNVAFPNDMQNELLGVSNHFGVAVGLAERLE